MSGNKKYYCVWSEDETMLCLTTDNGIALDVFANHMNQVGRLTDDDWSDTTAFIEEFDEFPVTRKDIMHFLTDEECIAWNAGNTVML
jgi:hypothetical protein